MPSTKFEADMTSFKNGISSAKSEVKTLDQQMKMIDATFRATGNSEQALATKTQTLNSRMAAQKAIADQAKQALDAMKKEGIQPASESYQKMARELLSAQTGMMETQAALNDLSNGAIKAATSANSLEKGLNGISKKISLEQVITGINKITGGLESAANKAKQLGESIWNEIMNSARWADDTATMAQMFGIDVETFQRMQKLVTNGLDTTVEAMLNSQTKLKKGIGDEADKVGKAFETLGIRMKAYQKTATGQQLMPRDSIDLFWEAGQALMNLNDEFKQESLSQTLFGKSWKELVPLFKEYKNAQEYADALEKVKGIIDEEKMNAGADLNDKVAELKGNLTSLQNDILLTIAPSLNDLASSLNKVLESILDYLDTPEGKEMLESLGDSISDMFSGLKDISAEDAVNTFKETFASIVSGFEWISNNGETLLGVLGGIGAFWAGLKVSEGVLTLLKVITGLKELTGLGGATGLASGLAQTLTGGITAGASMLNNPLLTANIPVLGDWFVHNTGIGQELILGTKEKGSTWAEIKQNAADWWETYKGVIGNARNYWNNQRQIQLAADEWNIGDATIEESLQFVFDKTHPKVEVIPEVPEDTPAKIQEQVGTVQIHANIIPTMAGYVIGGPAAGGGSGKPWLNQTHANGLPFVPFDNYLAILHKGERVVPAREVANNSRSFTSNTYFDNVVVNNGQDAEGLAQRIAAAQRREMNSLGS